MYPSPSHSAHQQKWQSAGNEGNRFPPGEPGAYPPREQQSGYPPREPPPNGYAPREEVNRHPLRDEHGNYTREELAGGRYTIPDDPRELGPLGHPPQLPPPGPALPPATPNQDRMDMYHMQSQGPDWNRMPHQHQMAFSQPAPRQRTAIACRYCRRRKIRCSGFESSPDGRCSNCQRFNQECIFTPVSSQTQAFVPAHTQYPQMRQQPGGRGGGRQVYPPGPVQLYGAHGQPLNVQPPPNDSPGYMQSYPRGPSPGSHSGPYDAPYDGQQPFGEHRDRGPVDLNQPPLARRSSQGDYPASWQRDNNSPPRLKRDEEGQKWEGYNSNRGYSPPGVLHGPPPPPASSSYGGFGEGTAPGFYPPGGPRRNSPPYSDSRPSSISPHPIIHPPMWPGPPRPESAGPQATGHALPPMSMANLIDQTQGQQRSAADNEMLNQLKRSI